MQSLRKSLNSKRLSFESIEELKNWIKENVVEKEKRDIINDPSNAFNEDVIVITDKNKPEGVFINLKNAKVLPPEIQAFLFITLNALGCKYLKS
jgi:hypothetical protein